MRHGVALTLAALSQHLKAREQLPLVFAFLKHALGDEDCTVAAAMVAAGREIIERHQRPGEMILTLVPMLESFLAEPATTEAHDRTRQGIVLYMASLVKHIPPDDAKVSQVFKRLMDALSTPSEMVQRSISQSLAALVGKAAVKPDAPLYVTSLLSTLTTTPSYAVRRGAAFGLAGLVKGLGISSLKQHGVMDRLKCAVEGKAKGEQTSNAREGALHAFELLCEVLGRLFEPYIITILPLLLQCVADGSGGVRYAAVAASQRIMSQLTAQGVRMVLPALLHALAEDKWRSVHASVELLGAMAYCAPKQLSSTLPQVVPALTEVLTHSHPRVKDSANAALASVGAVIKNPEIAAIVPTLLHALSEPSSHTQDALDALAKTQFEHYVDTPSLALIVPVLHRGLRDKASSAKRKTSHITGNMCSLLSERRDIVPYLPLLLPELQAVLHDPIPEVRSTGAKALGRLCAGLGEEHFPALLPWLFASLEREGSAVERAGAAQGLAEILSALGDAKVAEMLPVIIKGCESASVGGREGFSMLWTHLPAVLGRRLEPFVKEILPVVLSGLGDEAAPVRECCFRGAHAIIREYLEVASRLLLPPLQSGLAADNYRIRQSSAELLGTLVRRLTDGEHLEVVELDEAPPTGSPLAALPVGQQHALLASVYIARHDAQPGVRSAASGVWKSLISNAPRTLRVILRAVTDQLIAGLCCSSEDQQHAAANALGELVAKLAERVLPKLVPIMQSGLDEGDEARRRGVCLGLSEMMSAAGRDLVRGFLHEIIPAVRTALCDPDDAVREVAAQAFSTLQRLIGGQAITEIVPSLLQLLRADDSAKVAMGQAGLREVMSQRPQAVVPYLLPKLTQPPINLSHARALAAVAEVAGAALHTHLDSLVPALLVEIYLEADVAPPGKVVDPQLRSALVGAADAVAAAVEEDGLHYLVTECKIATAFTSPPHVRAAGANLIETLCKSCAYDLSPYHAQLVQSLIGLFRAPEAAVQRAGIRGLDSLVKSLPKERYVLHVDTLRGQLFDVAAEHKAHQIARSVPPAEASLLPALSLPNGIGALVAVYLQGLMTGTPELREQSAKALGECVGLTDPHALKPCVVQITGPLIRIVGDRFPAGVKAAILHTLTLLLMKAGAFLKAFVPQLQTTFVKSLADPTKIVRMRAAAALSKLAVLATRIEPLATDLHTALAAAAPALQPAYLVALGGVLRGVTKPLSDGLLAKLQASALELLTNTDDEMSKASASLLGALGKWVHDLSSLLEAVDVATECGSAADEGWRRQLWAVRVQQSILRTVKAEQLSLVLSTMFTPLGVAARAEKIDVRQPAAHALARLAAAMATPTTEDIAQTQAEGGDLEELGQATSAAVPTAVHDLLVALLNDKVMEVRLSAMHAVKTLCKLRPPLLRAANRHAACLYSSPIITLGCNDNRHLPVKSAAQRTLMHLCTVCGWVDAVAPTELAAIDQAAADYVANFVKTNGAMRRLAGLESEAEYSDCDPNDDVPHSDD